MAGLNIGDVISINMEGRIHNQKTISTFFYKVTTASTSPNTLTALGAVAGNFTQGVDKPGLAFIQAAPPNWTAVTVRAQRVWPDRSQYVNATPGLPGTAGTDAETANIMGTITRRTVNGGRRFIGALHTAPLPGDALQDGLITNTHLARMATVASRITLNWTVLLETTQLTPILWSYSSPADVSRLVESTLVQQEVRTMRRRTLGLGI